MKIHLPALDTKDLLVVQLGTVLLATLAGVALLLFGIGLVDAGVRRTASDTKSAADVAEAAALLSELSDLMGQAIGSFMSSAPVASLPQEDQVALRREILRQDEGPDSPNLPQIQATMAQADAFQFMRAVGTLMDVSEEIAQRDEAPELGELGIAITSFSTQLDAYFEDPSFGNFRRLRGRINVLRADSLNTLPALVDSSQQHEENLLNATSQARTGIFALGVILGGVVLGISLIAGRRSKRQLEMMHQERQALLESSTRLHHLNEQLTGLYNVFTEISDTLSLRYVIQTALRETQHILDADVVCIRLLKDGVLEVQGTVGTEGRESPVLLPVPLGEGPVGRAAKRGRTIRIESDAAEALPEGQQLDDVQSGIVVPLIVGARVVGTLSCWSIASGRFGGEDERILEMLASQLATTVVAAESTETSERRAHHDPLTALPNRLQLSEDLGGFLSQVSGADGQLVVAMADIDHFKRLNDDFGHRVGDVTLQKVAAVLRNSVRENDRVYRYGGEEFVIMFMDAGTDEALALAERVRLAVAETPLTGIGLEPVGPVTISIGLAVLPEDSIDLNQLIEMADSAMYASKEGGRNRTTLWRDRAGFITTTAVTAA